MIHWTSDRLRPTKSYRYSSGGIIQVGDLFIHAKMYEGTVFEIEVTTFKFLVRRQSASVRRVNLISGTTDFTRLVSCS
jgi:hypothetical protein